MSSIKLLLIMAVLLLILTASTALVEGHAVIIPNKSIAGEEQEYTIAVVGEREQPTVEVEIRIPEGFKLIEASPAEGWEYMEKVNDDAEVSVVFRGELGMDETAKLKIRLRNPSREGLYRFTVIQTYADGKVNEWNFPATWVKIERPGLWQILSRNMPYIIFLAVAAAVSLAVFVIRRRS